MHLRCGDGHLGCGTTVAVDFGGFTQFCRLNQNLLNDSANPGLSQCCDPQYTYVDNGNCCCSEACILDGFLYDAQCNLDAEAVREHLEFFDTENNQFIIYCLKNHANGDAYEKIAVLFHVGEARESVMLPEGNWKVLVNEKQAGTAVLEEIAGNEIWMDGPMAMVLVK